MSGRNAPAPSGDLLLHIRAEQMDLSFELATQIMAALGDAVTGGDEVQGFLYFDMRSIIGSVDGTEIRSAGGSSVFFIGYARSPMPMEQMLNKLFVGKPPGNYDKLLGFSMAVTGSLYFVPSTDLLNELEKRQGAKWPY